MHTTSITEPTVNRLRIVVVHNRYRYSGGEDAVFLAESRLLAAHGHQVRTVTVDNHDLDPSNPMRLARQTIWNRRMYAHLRRVVRRERAQVVHFHNTFPIVSPAGYYAARAEGASVVQTLHNFRLVCPNAVFYRSGRVCEDCLQRRLPWPSVVHACYRNSRPASLVTATMLAVHQVAGTWVNLVDRYIALSEFSRRKFVAGGIPDARLVVKSNCLATDPGVGPHDAGFALYVGRLTPEKGLDDLLAALARIPRPLRLKVVGSGPLAQAIRRAHGGVEHVGPLPEEDVVALMQRAAVLVFPSRVYENFPVVILQAFATGLPVIATGHGSLAEIVADGVTGWHVQPGNAGDLAEKLERALASPEGLRQMGARARAEFETRYTAERNYRELLDVYHQAGTSGGGAS